MKFITLTYSRQLKNLLSYQMGVKEDNFDSKIAMMICHDNFLKIFFLSEIGANNILKHYINCVFVFVNLLLTRKPYRILHFYIPLTYSVVFILFSLVYQKGFNQNAIYSALDWNNVPNVFIYALGIPLIFIPLLTFLLHTVTFIRDTIWRQCEDKSRQNSTQSC